ncbi:hypothetical protein [Azospirillum doebereinerae]
MDFTESRMKAEENNNNVINELWKSYSKFILLVNGGSILSVLTFLGSIFKNIESINAHHHGMKSFIWAISIYIIGIFSINFSIYLREWDFNHKLKVRSNKKTAYEYIIDIFQMIAISSFPVGSIFGVLGLYRFIFSQ